MELTLEREELPVTAEYCPKWIFTATEGDISSEKWAFEWNQIRAKWHPQYFFRWNVVDSHTLEEGYIPEQHQIQMESAKVDCNIEDMHNSKEEGGESRTSYYTVAGNSRCRCTVFLVAIGILLITAITIPLVFFIISPEDNSNELVGRVSVELSLVKINYTDQIFNKSSMEYRLLSEIFELEMKKLYGNSSFQTKFIRCRVNNITKGPRVQYEMFFDILNRRIPSTNEIKDILYSVARDKNDPTLGVLGELMFRIDTVQIKDKTSVSKSQIKDSRNTIIINDRREDQWQRYGNDTNNQDSKKVNVHNNQDDTGPSEQTTKDLGIPLLESMIFINTTYATETLSTQDITQNREESTAIDVIYKSTVKLEHDSNKVDIDNILANNDPTKHSAKKLEKSGLENKIVTVINKSEKITSEENTHTKKEFITEAYIEDTVHYITSTPSSFVNTTAMETFQNNFNSTKDATHISTRKLEFSTAMFERSNQKTTKIAKSTKFANTATLSPKGNVSHNAKAPFQNESYISANESATSGTSLELEITPGKNIYSTPKVQMLTTNIPLESSSFADDNLSSTLDYFYDYATSTVYDYATSTENSSTHKPNIDITFSNVNIQEVKTINISSDHTQSNIRGLETSNDANEEPTNLIPSVASITNVTYIGDFINKYQSTTERRFHPHVSNEVKVTTESFTNIPDVRTSESFFSNRVYIHESTSGTSSQRIPDMTIQKQSSNGTPYSNIKNFKESKPGTLFSSTDHSIDKYQNYIVTESPLITGMAYTSTITVTDDKIITTESLPKVDRNVTGINTDRIKSTENITYLRDRNKDNLNDMDISWNDSSIILSIKEKLATTIKHNSKTLKPSVVDAYTTKSFTTEKVRPTFIGITNLENSPDHLTETDREYIESPNDGRKTSLKTSPDGRNDNKAYNTKPYTSILVTESISQSSLESKNTTYIKYKPLPIIKSNSATRTTSKPSSGTNDIMKSVNISTDSGTRYFTAPTNATLFDKTVVEPESKIKYVVPAYDTVLSTIAPSNSIANEALRANTTASFSRNDKTTTDFTFFNSTSSVKQNTDITVLYTATVKPVAVTKKTFETTPFTYKNNPIHKYRTEFDETTLEHTFMKNKSITKNNSISNSTATTLIPPIKNTITDYEEETTEPVSVAHGRDMSNEMKLYPTTDRLPPTKPTTIGAIGNVVVETISMFNDTSFSYEYVYDTVTVEAISVTDRKNVTYDSVFDKASVESITITNSTKSTMYKNASDKLESLTSDAKLPHENVLTGAKFRPISDTNDTKYTNNMLFENVTVTSTHDSKHSLNSPFVRTTADAMSLSNITNNITSDIATVETQTTITDIINDIITDSFENVTPLSISDSYGSILANENASDKVNALASDEKMTQSNLFESKIFASSAYNTKSSNNSLSDIVTIKPISVTQYPMMSNDSELVSGTDESISETNYSMHINPSAIGEGTDKHLFVTNYLERSHNQEFRADTVGSTYAISALTKLTNKNVYNGGTVKSISVSNYSQISFDNSFSKNVADPIPVKNTSAYTEIYNITGVTNTTNATGCNKNINEFTTHTYDINPTQYTTFDRQYQDVLTLTNATKRSGLNELYSKKVITQDITTTKIETEPESASDDIMIVHDNDMMLIGDKYITDISHTSPSNLKSASMTSASPFFTANFNDKTNPHKTYVTRYSTQRGISNSKPEKSDQQPFVENTSTRRAHPQMITTDHLQKSSTLINHKKSLELTGITSIPSNSVSNVVRPGTNMFSLSKGNSNAKNNRTTTSLTSIVLEQTSQPSNETTTAIKVRPHEDVERLDKESRKKITISRIPSLKTVRDTKQETNHIDIYNESISDATDGTNVSQLSEDPIDIYLKSITSISNNTASLNNTVNFSTTSKTFLFKKSLSNSKSDNDYPDILYIRPVRKIDKTTEDSLAKDEPNREKEKYNPNILYVSPLPKTKDSSENIQNVNSNHPNSNNGILYIPPLTTETYLMTTPMHPERTSQPNSYRNDVNSTSQTSYTFYTTTTLATNNITYNDTNSNKEIIFAQMNKANIENDDENEIVPSYSKKLEGEYVTTIKTTDKTSILQMPSSTDQTTSTTRTTDKSMLTGRNINIITEMIKNSDKVTENIISKTNYQESLSSTTQMTSSSNRYFGTNTNEQKVISSVPFSNTATWNMRFGLLQIMHFFPTTPYKSPDRDNVSTIPDLLYIANSSSSTPSFVRTKLSEKVINRTSDNNENFNGDSFSMNKILLMLSDLTTPLNNINQIETKNKTLISNSKAPLVESKAYGFDRNTELTFQNATDTYIANEVKPISGEQIMQIKAKKNLKNSTHSTSKNLNVSSKYGAKNISYMANKYVPTLLSHPYGNTNTAINDVGSKGKEQSEIKQTFKHLWDLGESDVLRNNSISSPSVSPFSLDRKHTLNDDTIVKPSSINTRFQYLLDAGDSLLHQKKYTTRRPTISSIDTITTKRSTTVPSTNATVYTPASTYKTNVRYLWNLGNNVLSSLLGNVTVKQSDIDLREENILRMNNLLAELPSNDDMFKSAKNLSINKKISFCNITMSRSPQR